MPSPLCRYLPPSRPTSSTSNPHPRTTIRQPPGANSLSRRGPLTPPPEPAMDAHPQPWADVSSHPTSRLCGVNQCQRISLLLPTLAEAAASRPFPEPDAENKLWMPPWALSALRRSGPLPHFLQRVHSHPGDLGGEARGRCQGSRADSESRNGQAQAWAPWIKLRMSIPWTLRQDTGMSLPWASECQLQRQLLVLCALYLLFRQ